MPLLTYINYTLTVQATIPTRNVRLTADQGLFVGDSFTLKVNVGGMISGTTLTKAYMTCKTLPTDADVAALFQKTLTTTWVSGQGQITAAGSTGTATLQFELSTTNTGALTANATHFFDISVVSDDGTIHTVCDGTIVAGLSITAAVS